MDDKVQIANKNKEKESMTFKTIELSSKKQSILNMSNIINNNHTVSNLNYSVSEKSSFNIFANLPAHNASRLSDRIQTGNIVHKDGSIIAEYYCQTKMHLTRQRLLKFLDANLFKPKQKGKKVSRSIGSIKESCYQSEGESPSEQETLIFWEMVDNNEFLKKVKQSKKASIQIQGLIESGEASQKLMDLIKFNTPALIEDPFGCYIVRKASIDFKEIRKVATETVMKDVLRLAGNDHSSRVMQTLATYSKLLRTMCMKELSENWEFVLSRISTIFLLSVCLRYTENTNLEFLKIGITLRNHPSLLFECKNNKRVLVSYLEYCQEEEMEVFFKLLSFDKFFVKRMDDKYMVYIFSIFLSRIKEKAKCILMREITTQPSILLDSGNFRYLLFRVFNNNRLKDIRDDIALSIFGVLEKTNPRSIQPNEKQYLFQGRTIGQKKEEEYPINSPTVLKKKKNCKNKYSHYPSRSTKESQTESLQIPDRLEPSHIIYLSKLLLSSSISFDTNVIDTILNLNNLNDASIWHGSATRTDPSKGPAATYPNHPYENDDSKNRRRGYNEQYPYQYHAYE